MTLLVVLLRGVFDKVWVSRKAMLIAATLDGGTFSLGLHLGYLLGGAS